MDGWILAAWTAGKGRRGGGGAGQGGKRAKGRHRGRGLAGVNGTRVNRWACGGGRGWGSGRHIAGQVRMYESGGTPIYLIVTRPPKIISQIKKPAKKAKTPKHHVKYH